MKEVEAFIWHDGDGKIHAVGHVLPGIEETIEPLAIEGHSVLRVRMPVGTLDTLHLTHAVDPKGGALVSARKAD